MAFWKRGSRGMGSGAGVERDGEDISSGLKGSGICVGGLGGLDKGGIG